MLFVGLHQSLQLKHLILQIWQWPIYTFLSLKLYWTIVPAPVIKEICGLHYKICTVMIFSTSEPPQYIVVPPNDGEMKDMIGYHNKHLTGKISNYTAFFEKCGYLLSAIYLA